MTCAEAPTLDTSRIPDLPYRLALDDLICDQWEITAEEDEKITQAAKPNLISRALAGDDEALLEMKQLKVVRWETRR